jgi:hypothetical protein
MQTRDWWGKAPYKLLRISFEMMKIVIKDIVLSNNNHWTIIFRDGAHDLPV